MSLPHDPDLTTDPAFTDAPEPAPTGLLDRFKRRAAADLARHATVVGSPLPSDLLRDCEQAGLLVLAPIKAA